jgi:hypothetical protein
MQYLVGNQINIDYDNYNFYMSQCQIRVEMTFRMMVNRFGVHWIPLQVSILNIGPLIQCIARLHNSILNNNNKYNPQK